MELRYWHRPFTMPFLFLRAYRLYPSADIQAMWYCSSPLTSALMPCILNTARLHVLLPWICCVWWSTVIFEMTTGFIIPPPDMMWQVFFSLVFRIFTVIDIVSLWRPHLLDLGSDTCIVHPPPCSWTSCVFSSSDVCMHPWGPNSTLSKRHLESSTDPDNLWVQFSVDKHMVLCLPSVLKRILLARMEAHSSLA